MSGIMGYLDDVDEHLSHASIMLSSYPRHNFLETDAMFLEFEDELDNFAGGSSSMATMRDSDFLETCAVSTLRVGVPCCSTWAHSDDDRPWCEETYFHISRLLQPGGRFVEHQMLTTFKEFWADCHRHIKKYSYPKEAHVNPPNILVGCHED
ncbi:gamma-aminobutyrate transaminase POP2 [Cucumis melo var. makuwa]|uniref:Gamma-aminobutyrate transaminase POP2 n=1 Tax=Cucumis melo var. makuwa TaxID=1194695 RepID=A0A5D3BYW1_CUCMM|nr:gamma-aminobutyrate transaminase POP2 [Cucumis melo var. makuwa]